MNSVPVITIDGPTGSGKGTVARRVAKTLGFGLLDSGAIYRVLAVAAARQSILQEDVDALVALVGTLDIAFGEDGQGAECITLHGQDITREVRLETTGEKASRIAPQPQIRSALLTLQRQFRQAPGLVADGRDMGTVVFPDAVCKVFLTASAAARAERRYKQLKEKGFDGSLATLFDDIAQRDARDATRAVAPLRPAADAFQIDSTALGIDEVVQRVLDLANQRITTTDP